MENSGSELIQRCFHEIDFGGFDQIITLSDLPMMRRNCAALHGMMET